MRWAAMGLWRAEGTGCYQQGCARGWAVCGGTGLLLQLLQQSGDIAAQGLGQAVP